VAYDVLTVTDCSGLVKAFTGRACRLDAPQADSLGARRRTASCAEHEAVELVNVRTEAAILLRESLDKPSA
jgi:hypothetical protein